MGIEPTYEAWEAAVLPLNYTRGPVRILPFTPVVSRQRFSSLGRLPSRLTALIRSRVIETVLLRLEVTEQEGTTPGGGRSIRGYALPSCH